MGREVRVPQIDHRPAEHTVAYDSHQDHQAKEPVLTEKAQKRPWQGQLLVLIGAHPEAEEPLSEARTPEPPGQDEVGSGHGHASPPEKCHGDGHKGLVHEEGHPSHPEPGAGNGLRLRLP